MNSKNIVILTGRLTRDIELKTTQSGVSVASFSIAVNRPKRSGEDSVADFINVVAWRQGAEFAAKYFRKGDAMTVIGSIQTRSYIDNEGKSRNAFEVVADLIEFPLTAKPKEAQDGVSGVGTGNSVSGAKTAENGGFEAVEGEDDLPF